MVVCELVNYGAATGVPEHNPTGWGTVRAARRAGWALVERVSKTAPKGRRYRDLYG